MAKNEKGVETRLELTGKNKHVTRRGWVDSDTHADIE